MTRLRIDTATLRHLLAGEPVRVVHRAPGPPPRGESVPVTLAEPLEVRALILGSERRPKTKRVWEVRAMIDRLAPPMLLSAESGGGVIHPLPESVDPEAPEAHGYTTREADAIPGESEAVPPEEVSSYATSQLHAQRFAVERVDELTKRKARSLANQTRDALMQARAHGVDVEPFAEQIEGALAAIHRAVREAA